jgi:4-amino-4-deoxy-L-arabinose transferase-like glycosyltransferase
MIPRPPEPPRGLDGLPVADPLEERAARAVAWVATVWFALAASWELFGPLLAGHYASSASVGIIAENMLRWRIPGPVWEYTRTPPTPAMYYCHHPWGIFWTTAVLLKLLGRHDFICRLAPVLLSIATPPLLYATGRAIWRPAAGAAATAAFVVLPITLAFASFNALEVPVMAWSALSLWGFVRMTQTGRRRHLAASLAGAFMAVHADWPGIMLVGALLGFAVVRYLAGRAFGPLRHERSYAIWWILVSACTAGSFLLYIAVFNKVGKLNDLFGSYGQRSSGNNLPLAKVLQDPNRRYWIELSFSPIAIALGKVLAVVSLVRLAVLRREHEVIPLLVLLMATAQYVVFKQGADIHVFWPQYFGLYFALAMGALVATITPLLARLRVPASRAPLIALGVALLPILAVARDGVPALAYARGTGGRFNEKGLIIHSDGAKTAFLRFVARGLAPDAAVDMHEGMKTTWSQVWELGGRIVAQNRPPPARGRGGSPYLADTRFMLSGLQGDLARGFHVTAVGPFWEVLPGEPAAPIDAFAVIEREPSWWEWYLVSGTEPHREIAPDPYLTWELRTHFGQTAEVPAAPPATLDQKRIAHNIAVATGDRARAAALYEEITHELQPAHAVFDDGTEIVGTTFHDGARPLLTIFLKAGGPTAGDVQLTVRSKVTARAAWSTTMADPTDREVGIPLAIAPQRWRKGFLYSDPVAIRKRPGTEVYRASFWVRGPGVVPKRQDGDHGPVEVLTLR